MEVLILVRINCIDGDDESTIDREAKVFTLSTRVWKSVSNIPLAYKTYCLTYGHVSIGGFIYWKAYDFVALGYHGMSNLIVSFDLKNGEFGKVCLPDSLVEADNISAFKFKESLGLIHHYLILMMGYRFVIYTGIVGFRKNGEAVMETEIDGCPSVLEVYEPSGPYNDIGVSEFDSLSKSNISTYDSTESGPALPLIPSPLVASSIGILGTIASVIQSSLQLKVIHDLSNWEEEKVALLKIVCVSIGLFVQIYSVTTTTSLIGNMSPPKRAS
nr:F-box domain-containing protein [Tanacetum cinerariifolium]